MAEKLHTIVGSGPAARFVWNLENRGLNEQREGKEASGSASHPREHMLGKDKGNRKQAGASAGVAPVGEESPCQGWAVCPAILQRIHSPFPVT